jgi:ribosomal protein S7
MYSLDCNYYKKEFNTVDELINDVMMSGMDPNYEITRNGKKTGEYVIELIQF